MPYSQSPRRAYEIYGQNHTAIYVNNPLVGFEYFVQINFNGNLGPYVRQYLNSTQMKGLNPLIKRVDMPSFKIDTDDINEYNRHRVSQSRMNFDPIKLVIHDVADGKALRFWAMYYEYYFKDGLYEYTAKDWTNPNPPDFIETRSDLFGYHIEEVKQLRYLITSIDIYRIHAGRYDRTELINPRITAFNQSELSYESGETLECEFTFQYENVHYYPMSELDQDGVIPEGTGDEHGVLYDFLAVGEVLVGGRGRIFDIQDTPPVKRPGAAEFDNIVYDTRNKPGGAKLSYQRTVYDSPLLNAQDGRQKSGFLANITEAAINMHSKIPTFDGIVESAVGFIDSATGVNPIKLLEAGKSTIGKVAEINALGGQFNQLQRDLFGEVLVEAPQTDVRDFNKYVSTVSRGYEDTTRFTRNVEQTFGIGNGTRNTGRSGFSGADEG